MQEFIAKEPDLILNLTVLSGEKIELKPKIQISGKGVLEVTNKWTKLEKDKKLSPIEIVVIELSYVYPKTSEWFLENFDFENLNAMLIHVAQTIGGFKKKSKS